MFTITNGRVPLNISNAGTSFTTAARTYTVIPTGGVISPVSQASTTITPNQMGSKPRVVTIGKKIGTVRRTIARLSKKVPRIKYISIIIIITKYGETGKFLAKSAVTNGSLLAARRYPNKFAPITIMNSIAVSAETSNKALKIFSQTSPFLNTSRTKAPKAQFRLPQ